MVKSRIEETEEEFDARMAAISSEAKNARSFTRVILISRWMVLGLDKIDYRLFKRTKVSIAE